MRKEKYLLIYLKTGGGHYAPAKSIAEYLQSRYADQIEPKLIHAFKETFYPVRYFVEDGYRIAQAKARWYYEFLYFTNKLKPVAAFNRMITSVTSFRYLEKTILTEKPDKIIVFHFFSYMPVYRVLKKHRLQIPVLTVVTDPFTAHPLWFLKHDQHFIVFSERLKQHCIRHGIQEDSLHLFPFVLEEKFSNPVPENNIVELKKRYCADPEKKTLLILGGGDGIPNGYELLKLLLKAKLDCNIIVVCGRNKGLLKKSQDLITKENNNSVFVYGYVDFIYELINVSDVVITKCGASTIMEILFLEKIPIIINYIWEQEKGNVEYVVQNKMGIFEKEIHRVPELVKKLFSEQSYYQEFIAQIDKQHLINGTAAVSEFIRTFK